MQTMTEVANPVGVMVFLVFVYTYLLHFQHRVSRDLDPKPFPWTPIAVLLLLVAEPVIQSAGQECLECSHEKETLVSPFR